MLTDDENIIDIQFAVQYILQGSHRVPVQQPRRRRLRHAGGRDRDPRGRRQEQDGFRALRRPRAGREPAPRRCMQKILDRYKTGISISKVTMQQAQPPEQVQAAFDDAVKANQDRERQKNEGQAYSNDVVPKARGTAARLTAGSRRLPAARDRQRRRRGLALQPDHDRVQQAPAVTRQRLYLDAMQQVLTNTTKIVVDQKSGSNLLLPAAGQDPADGRCGCRGLGRYGQRRGGGVPARRGACRGSALTRCVPQPRPGGTSMTAQCRSNPHRARRRCWWCCSLSLFTVDQRQNAIVFRLGETGERDPRAGAVFQGAAARQRALLRRAHPHPGLRRSPSASSPPRRRTCWSIRS